MAGGNAGGAAAAAARVLFSAVLGLVLLPLLVAGDDPYRFFTWTVTYGDIYPLGVKQQGILINNQFPGPQIEAVTNDNLIINVFNKLNEPFLLSWSGLQQRRNSFEDGVAGTTCPIPPGANFTYIMQAKDQIGTYYYFPSLAFHKAAGGFGGIRVLSRPQIPVPFPPPAADYTVLIGDWYKANHTDLKYVLDNGKAIGFPDGLLINGRSLNGYTFTVQPGRTYRFRITNVGLATSLNIRFQGHSMKLVEVEGSHTMQTTYSSLDVHLGQSYSVLLTADQPGFDYAVVVSTRFTSRIISTTAVLHYANSAGRAPGAPPGGPTIQIDWSLNQARSIRWNLTASGPRPNPQGSYHYGLVPVGRTIRLANSAAAVNGKQRYAVNSASYVGPDTPLKVADYYKIAGVFSVGTIADGPTYGAAYLQTSVMGASYRDYVEIVFENSEDEVQSWHIDGYAFWVVGMDGGKWSSASRQGYNLRDGVSRYTVQKRCGGRLRQERRGVILWKLWTLLSPAYSFEVAITSISLTSWSTPGHGRRSTCPWTTWACGTSGRRTGPGSTWGSSSTSASGRRRRRCATSTPSPRTRSCAAGRPVAGPGRCDSRRPPARRIRACHERMTGTAYTLLVWTSGRCRHRKFLYPEPEGRLKGECRLSDSLRSICDL